MKKKLFITLIFAFMLLIVIPIAAGASDFTNFSYSPKTMKETGGEVTLTFTINNTDPLVADRYHVYFFGTLMANRDINIASGGSQAVSPKITITPDLLDVWIPVEIVVQYSDGFQESIGTKNIKIDSIPDVIYSTKKSTIPDQSMYHIGQTIQITDNFLNRSNETATNVTVQYYKKVTIL